MYAFVECFVEELFVVALVVYAATCKRAINIAKLKHIDEANFSYYNEVGLCKFKTLLAFKFLVPFVSNSLVMLKP